MTIEVADLEISDRNGVPNIAHVGKEFITHLLAQVSDLQGFQGDSADWLKTLRQDARDRLSLLKIPTPKDEDWKYTDLSLLVKQSFQSSSNQLDPTSLTEVADYLLPETATSRVTVVNGNYVPPMSDVSGLPDQVFVGSLSQADATQIEHLLPKLRSHLGEHASKQDVFATINTACLTDVVVVYVPRNTIVEVPIQLLFVTEATTQAITTQPRCLIIAETNSSLTLVETHTGIGDQPYFTNAVLEVWLGENAQINHSQVQWETPAAFHISTSAIAQSRDSRYTNQCIDMGAQLARHNLSVQQTAVQTETYLYGLAMVDGEGLADTHSAIVHNFPHGTSKQLHKCIVDDQGHAVFNGKIQVAKDAQLTNSSQLNRNLLLSPKARVDTKPELEIFADDVKCAHGATVSQLDADEIFYLQSRCIDAANAANLLTYAFAAEIISEVPIPSLKQKLEQFVLIKTQ